MVLAILALLAQAPGVPAVNDGFARQTDVTIPRVDTSVTLDGLLDGPVWARASMLTGFSQDLPIDGVPATDSTEVLTWYSADAIYFGIRAYEVHGALVRATVADRDAVDADDNIQVLLDTYEDHRRALEFTVNPLGVQEDGVRTEGQNTASARSSKVRFVNNGAIDLNPDFIWESHGHVTPWGYEVEIRIPFKSIRFQDADPQTWGIQIVREVAHSGYEETWAPVARAASFLAQSGRLLDLHGLHRGLAMDLDPEVTTRVDGDSSGGTYRYHGRPEIGGNLHWGVTNTLSLSVTAHPDFSQVEADAAQVTVNQRFALFYPEKRPFFLDGLEQFATPNQLIYTRDIVQPVVGVKLIENTSKVDVAYLGAVDAPDLVTGSHPLYNIIRMRRDVGPSTTLGLVYTDRTESDTYGRLAGADARVTWDKLWYSQVQVAESWTRTAQGARAGTLWDIVLGDRTGRAYDNHFEVRGFSPSFQAASGFVSRTGIVQVFGINQFAWYGAPGAFVERFAATVGLNPLWHYGDFLHARGASEGGYIGALNLTARGGWSVFAQVSNRLQRFDPAAYVAYAVDRGSDTIPFVTPLGLYHLWSGLATISSPNRALTFSGSSGYGAAVIFPEAAEGREFKAQLSLTWRPSPSVRIIGTLAHDRITRTRDGRESALANIPHLELDYQLSRALFIRYIGQYVAQRQAPLEDPRTGQPLLVSNGTPGRYSAVGAVASNLFRSDFLFSYKPTPGTVLFLGYGASLTEPEALALSAARLRRIGDGWFFKGSYLYSL